MTYEEFMELKGGDIVLFQTGTRRFTRTIMSGPADDQRAKRHPSIVLPILKRSWTGRIETVRHWNDVKTTLIGKVTSQECLISPEEAERHLRKGFKKKDFFRAMKNQFVPRNKAETTWYRCCKPFYVK